MALACGPDLLIADEPTTALDVTIQRQILDLIRDLVAERGMALLLISHDLGVIAQNVQRMMVMYGGSVVESGADGCGVRAHARIPTRRACSRRGPRLRRARRAQRLATIAGTVPELADLPPGCPFADRCAIVDARVPRGVAGRRAMSAPGHRRALHPARMFRWPRRSEHWRA